MIQIVLFVSGVVFEVVLAVLAELAVLVLEVGVGVGVGVQEHKFYFMVRILNNIYSKLHLLDYILSIFDQQENNYFQMYNIYSSKRYTSDFHNQPENNWGLKLF